MHPGIPDEIHVGPSIDPRGNSRARLTRHSVAGFDDQRRRRRSPSPGRRNLATCTLQELGIIGRVFSRIQFPDAIFFSVGPGESNARAGWTVGGKWQRERKRYGDKGVRGRVQKEVGEGKRCGAAHIRALWHVPSRSQLN